MIVATTLYPLYDFARTIGGDNVNTTTLLLPPGMEAHSFEPKPDDAIRITNADMFVYTNEYMEPWAVNFVKGLNSGNVALVDSSKGIKFLKAGVEEDAEDEHENHYSTEARPSQGKRPAGTGGTFRPHSTKLPSTHLESAILLLSGILSTALNQGENSYETCDPLHPVSAPIQRL